MASDLVSALRTAKDVHLWLRRLDLDTEPSPAEVDVLNADERARAERFLRDVDRRRFVRRHLHLRNVLARCLETAPADVPLDATLHRPPRLTGGALAADLRFSLSSSGDRSAVAIAWRRPVGVDIERIDSEVDLLSVSRSVFSAAERHALEAKSGDERSRCFFRIWARKEAFVKAKGTGLARDLMSFDVMASEMSGLGADTARVVDRETETDARPWLVRDVHGPPDFALACCTRGDDWSIVRHENGA